MVKLIKIIFFVIGNRKATLTMDFKRLWRPNKTTASAGYWNNMGSSMFGFFFASKTCYRKCFAEKFLEVVYVLPWSISTTPCKQFLDFVVDFLLFRVNIFIIPNSLNDVVGVVVKAPSTDKLLKYLSVLVMGELSLIVCSWKVLDIFWYLLVPFRAQKLPLSFAYCYHFLVGRVLCDMA